MFRDRNPGGAVVSKILTDALLLLTLPSSLRGKALPREDTNRNETERLSTPALKAEKFHRGIHIVSVTLRTLHGLPADMFRGGIGRRNVRCNGLHNRWTRGESLKTNA